MNIWFNEELWKYGNFSLHKRFFIVEKGFQVIKMFIKVRKKKCSFEWPLEQGCQVYETKPAQLLIKSRPIKFKLWGKIK